MVPQPAGSPTSEMHPAGVRAPVVVFRSKRTTAASFTLVVYTDLPSGLAATEVAPLRPWWVAPQPAASPASAMQPAGVRAPVVVFRSKRTIASSSKLVA